MICGGDTTPRRALADEAVRGPEQGLFGPLNKAFHASLYEPCGGHGLLAHIAGLNEIADRYLRVAAAGLDYADRSHREHRALLDACRRRDASAACDILRRHIEEAGDALYALLSK